MTRDEWSTFLLERIQYHVDEYTNGTARQEKVASIIRLLPERWPSGWNIASTEAAVLLGVVHDTLLDTLEHLAHTQSAK